MLIIIKHVTFVTRNIKSWKTIYLTVGFLPLYLLSYLSKIGYRSMGKHKWGNCPLGLVNGHRETKKNCPHPVTVTLRGREDPPNRSHP